MEEKALIQDKFIVFQDFGTWCLILGQSRKIRDSWNLWVSTVRLVKHVERDNFPMILYRIAKS